MSVGSLVRAIHLGTSNLVNPESLCLHRDFDLNISILVQICFRRDIGNSFLYTISVWMFVTDST